MFFYLQHYWSCYEHQLFVIYFFILDDNVFQKISSTPSRLVDSLADCVKIQSIITMYTTKLNMTVKKLKSTSQINFIPISLKCFILPTQISNISIFVNRSMSTKDINNVSLPVIIAIIVWIILWITIVVNKTRLVCHNSTI